MTDRAEDLALARRHRRWPLAGAALARYHAPRLLAEVLGRRPAA